MGLRSGSATWTAHWSVARRPPCQGLASPASMLLLARAPQRCRHRRRCHRGLDRTLACCAPSPLASPTPVLLLAGDPQRSRRRPAAGAAAWPVARRRAPPAGLSAGCCGTLGSGSVPPSAANSMLLASHAARRALAAAAVRHGAATSRLPGLRLRPQHRLQPCHRPRRPPHCRACRQAQDCSPGLRRRSPASLAGRRR